MSFGNEYLEACVETLGQIKQAELESLTPGLSIGSGSTSTFRPIGKIQSIDQFAGLKILKCGSVINSGDRLAADAGQIAIHLEAAPELLPHVPLFMGLVVVSGTEHSAIITEDVSRNGQIPVYQVSASRFIRASLYKAFQNVGSLEDITSTEALNQTASFEAGDREVLLDFSPPPLRVELFGSSGGHKPFKDYYNKILDQIDSLTISVSAQSNIGKAIS